MESSTELSVGDTSSAGPVRLSAYKVDEKVLGLTVKSDAAEPLRVRVRYTQTAIGRNFDRGPNYGDTEYAKICIDPQTEIIVDPGDTGEMTLTITNWNHITRDFRVTFDVAVHGVSEIWHLDVQAEDTDFFAEPEILHGVNRTNNWHPNVLNETWETYVQQIG
jgi:hypothetical protein